MSKANTWKEYRSMIIRSCKAMKSKVRRIRPVSLGQEMACFELNLSTSQISVNFSTEKVATPKKKVRQR